METLIDARDEFKRRSRETADSDRMAALKLRSDAIKWKNFEAEECLRGSTRGPVFLKRFHPMCNLRERDQGSSF